MKIPDDATHQYIVSQDTRCADMASKSIVPFLVGMMLLTGVCNTLLTKYQVRIAMPEQAIFVG